MQQPSSLSIFELIDLLSPGQKLLGLDLGSKTIGLAISDFGFKIATPLETINRKKFTVDAETLSKICKEQNIGGLVYGLPLKMDGTIGPQAQSTISFVKNFNEKFNLPYTLWDERLSTVAVTRTLLEADTSRAKRAKVVDKLAASYILQGALDRFSSCDHLKYSL